MERRDAFGKGANVRSAMELADAIDAERQVANSSKLTDPIASSCSRENVFAPIQRVRCANEFITFLRLDAEGGLGPHLSHPIDALLHHRRGHLAWIDAREAQYLGSFPFQCTAAAGAGASQCRSSA